MTTTAEVKQLVAAYPADAQRLVLMPSVTLATDDGRDDLARDMVALANRDGGRIVIGVDVSGRYESELAIDPAEVPELVASVVRDRIVPGVEATVEHLSGEEGPLLVVQVPHRGTAPLAVARRVGQGRVGPRSFFIRDRDRTRGVSDAQLAWMYRVSGDPALSIPLCLPVHTGDGLEPAASVPQPRAIEYFGALAGKITEELGRSLAADDAVRSHALVELAPWALLAEVDAVLGAGDTLAAVDTSLDDLPVPGHDSVFADAPGGLRGVLAGDTGGGLRAMFRRRRVPTLALPERAEVLVDHLSHQRKTRVVLTHPEMVWTFSARATESGRGWYWRRDAAAERDGGGPVEGPAAGIRWVELLLEAECSLPFPQRAEGPDPAAEAFVAELEQRLRTRWDGVRFLDSLAPSYLESVAGP